MIKAAVIGDPISHSLSPKLHNFWLKKYAINGNYEAILVKNNDLAKAVEFMINNGFSGFNATIPHKETIFKICNNLSRKATLTKAVNTVIIDSNNQLFGDNSDCDGFINNAKYLHKTISFNDKNVFLIGAGGAARAIIYALIENGVKNIFIRNRDSRKAQILIQDFVNLASEKKTNLHYLEEEEFNKNLDKCDLLVNSTSLGMSLQPPLEINLQNLKSSAIVYDIVYKPKMTNLLTLAQNRGNKIITGFGMLIFQAAVGFEYWFKKKPEINAEIFLLENS